MPYHVHNMIWCNVDPQDAAALDKIFLQCQECSGHPALSLWRLDDNMEDGLIIVVRVDDARDGEIACQPLGDVNDATKARLRWIRHD